MSTSQNPIQLFEIEDSDQEFWTDFEKQPGEKLSDRKSLESRIHNSISQKFVYKDSPTKSQPNSFWIREYIEQKLSQVRDSTEPKIEASTIKARNQTKRQYESYIIYLKEKYASDFSLLMKDFLILKEVLYSKDKEINFLTKFLGDTFFFLC